MCGCSAANDKTEAASAPASASSGTRALRPPVEAATAVARAAPVADGRPIIVCFGDSLTAGYGVDPDLSYPADLQRNLDRAGFAYRVVNLGVSGDTTKDGLARVPNVLRLKPALVVVEFGGNDGLRGLPLGDTQRNLDTIVANLKKSGAKVALAGIILPPDYGPEYVGRFKSMFPMIAKKNGVALLPFLYKDVYGLDGFIQADGIHATAKGNLQVAKNIQGLLTPMLKK